MAPRVWIECLFALFGISAVLFVASHFAAAISLIAGLVGAIKIRVGQGDDDVDLQPRVFWTIASFAGFLVFDSVSAYAGRQYVVRCAEYCAAQGSIVTGIPTIDGQLRPIDDEVALAGLRLIESDPAPSRRDGGKTSEFALDFKFSSQTQARIILVRQPAVLGPCLCRVLVPFCGMTRAVGVIRVCGQSRSY